MEKFVHNAFDKKYGFDKINDRQALQERFDNIPKAKSIKPLNESTTKTIKPLRKRIKKSIIHKDEELLTEAPANLMTTPGTVANFLAQNIDTIWGITDPVELKQAVMDMIKETDEITKGNKEKTLYMLEKTPSRAILSTIATMITGCKV